MNGNLSGPPDALAPARTWLVAPMMIFAVGTACVCGCAGSQAGTATTTPVTAHDEPRGATGQLLEDAFFARVPGASRFDMDAATDEDGYDGGGYYDEVAAGEYDDELASGEEEPDDSEAAIRRDELRSAQVELALLETGLRAEAHPLTEAVAELRERIAGVLEEPEDSSDLPLLEETAQSILPGLLRAAEELTRSTPPRPGNATDCSTATIALYAAVYDTIVEVHAHTHVNAYSFTGEREEWEAAQAEQLDAAAEFLEWLDSAPLLDDLEASRDRALNLGDGLHEIDAYLTPGTQRGVYDALAALNEAETDRELSAALETLRAAVSATLANVQRPPYEAEITAFAELPEWLDAVMAQLPSPGPRAALQRYRQGEITRLAAIVGYDPEPLDGAMRWAEAACGAPP